jgi:hypothetical protein
MKFASLENRWAVGLVFLLLFVYLILRALFVPIYIDEVTTLFEYIESNKNWNESLSTMSANNHLLNTFLGKFMHQLFGDSIFCLRIPNILSFVLFFFSIKFTVKKSVHTTYQFLVFVALNTIVWIFEYFGYLRGYGLGLAFFFTAITYFYRWVENQKTHHFALFLLCLWLSFFANLSFFNSLAIFAFYAFLNVIFFFKKIGKKQLILHFVLLLVFILSVVPLINYSFDLKDAGALWWGNLTGIWSCTGRILVSLTFFHESYDFKYIFLLFYSLLASLGMYSFVIKGAKEFLFSLEGLFYTLLFGNMLLIEILAVFFKVNYPMDRAAMLLVFFTLITFVLAFQHVRNLKHLIFLLLYFPISFVFKMNLDSSVYQKNHRISPSVKNYLSENLGEQSSYSVAPLIEESSYFAIREAKQARLFYMTLESQNLQEVQPSFFLVDPPFHSKKIPSFYKRTLVDPSSKIEIYKDIRHLKYTAVKDTIIREMSSQNEFLGLVDNLKLSDLSLYHQFKIKMTGEVYFEEEVSDLNLTISLGDSLDKNKYYESNPLSLIAACKKSIDFIWNSPTYKILPGKQNCSIYFWNQEKKNLRYKNVYLTIYKVEIVK